MEVMPGATCDQDGTFEHSDSDLLGDRVLELLAINSLNLNRKNFEKFSCFLFSSS